MPPQPSPEEPIIRLSNETRERLLDLSIRWCDAPASHWLAGLSGVHRRRVDKDEAVARIEQRVVAHYEHSSIGSALMTREAKVLQKYHFRQRIHALAERLEEQPDAAANDETRRLIGYFREQFRSLDRLKEPGEIATYLARYYAEDMVAELNPAFFRAFRLLTNVIFRNFSRSLRVEDSDATFERLGEVLDNEPIFFVPNHVSNADHVPICLAIHRSGLPQPLIAAGANLYRGVSAKVMPLLNAYKIRREYIAGGRGLLQMKWFQNPLYRRVHSEYLRHVWDRNEPCMFYIEGTRSRTGLLGEPKTGILSEVQAYLRDTGRRAHFVPVSLSYSIVPEDVEIEAARKGKEISNKDLVTQLMELDRAFGEHRDAPIRMRFGTPVTVSAKMQPKEFAELLVKRIRDGLSPSCTSLLALGIEACPAGKNRTRFDPERVRRQIGKSHRQGLDRAEFDTALKIFRDKGFIAPDGDDGYTVTRPELIRQYANRLR